MPARRNGRRIAVVSVVTVVVLAGVAVWAGWEQILLLREFESLGQNAQGLREYRHRQTGIVFVSLPGGTFAMGSPDDEDGRGRDEGPLHEVELGRFLIAKFEISQAEWEAVTGTSPSLFKGEDLPVENVSWEDCQRFCADTGLVLPTEAQWEYACRSSRSTPYAGAGPIDELAWYEANSRGTTHPVGTRQPNAFGLHDMHGNVSEWCEDVYDADFYRNPGAVQRDPLSTRIPRRRVVRGGSWSDHAKECRSACRDGYPPSYRVQIIGFRPAARHPGAG